MAHQRDQVALKARGLLRRLMGRLLLGVALAPGDQAREDEEEPETDHRVPEADLPMRISPPPGALREPPAGRADRRHRRGPKTADLPDHQGDGEDVEDGDADLRARAPYSRSPDHAASRAAAEEEGACRGGQGRLRNPSAPAGGAGAEGHVPGARDRCPSAGRPRVGGDRTLAGRSVLADIHILF